MAADPAIADSLAKIRQYHALGSHVPRTKYGAMGDAADHLGLNIDYMRACRRFAQMYTTEQLDALCDACEAGGYAIGWSHMMLLLGVPEANKRDSLLRKAIGGKWSKSRLEAEIRGRRAPRAPRGAGRPMELDRKRPLETAYFKMLAVCTKFDSLMWAMRRAGKGEGSLLDTVPEATRSRMERAHAAMESLRQALQPKSSPKAQSNQKPEATAKKARRPE